MAFNFSKLRSIKAGRSRTSSCSSTLVSEACEMQVELAPKANSVAALMHEILTRHLSQLKAEERHAFAALVAHSVYDPTVLNVKTPEDLQEICDKVVAPLKIVNISSRRGLRAAGIRVEKSSFGGDALTHYKLGSEMLTITDGEEDDCLLPFILDRIAKEANRVNPVKGVVYVSKVDETAWEARLQDSHCGDYRPVKVVKLPSTLTEEEVSGHDQSKYRYIYDDSNVQVLRDPQEQEDFEYDDDVRSTLLETVALSVHSNIASEDAFPHPTAGYLRIVGSYDPHSFVGGQPARNKRNQSVIDTLMDNVLAKLEPLQFMSDLEDTPQVMTASPVLSRKAEATGGGVRSASSRPNLSSFKRSGNVVVRGVVHHNVSPKRAVALKSSTKIVQKNVDGGYPGFDENEQAAYNALLYLNNSSVKALSKLSKSHSWAYAMGVAFKDAKGNNASKKRQSAQLTEIFSGSGETLHQASKMDIPTPQLDVKYNSGIVVVEPSKLLVILLYLLHHMTGSFSVLKPAGPDTLVVSLN